MADTGKCKGDSGGAFAGGDDGGRSEGDDGANAASVRDGAGDPNACRAAPSRGRGARHADSRSHAIRGRSRPSMNRPTQALLQEADP